MRILVTGGVGFLGTNICLEAVVRGHEAIAFDNLVRNNTEENISVLEKVGVKLIRGDIRNKIDFDKLPFYPDAIIHLAAQPGIPYSIESPFYDFQVNVLGTLNVLEYARLHGKIPVIFASSNKVYTDIVNDLTLMETDTRYVWAFGEYVDASPTPELFFGVSKKGLNENIPLDAFGKYSRSPYGAAKISMDLYCQEYYQCFQLPTVINRMGAVYGYYQKGVEEQAWTSFFINQIAYGDGRLNIFGNGKQVRDMLWGEDCAKLYLDELENIDKVKGQVYNIGGGENNTMSLLEAVAFIEKETGKKASLTFHSERHADQRIWITDCTKIKNELGWKPKVSPEEGIKLILENKR